MTASSLQSIAQFYSNYYHLLIPAQLFAGVWYLFAKKYFPLPVARYVGRFLFLPTSPVTYLAHTVFAFKFGSWYNPVDKQVFLGAMPLPFHNVRDVFNKGVRAAINLCDEYSGPLSQYRKLGVQQLYLPTVDHFEPSAEDMRRAVQYIEEVVNRGDSVYLHCRAGHGRSAAVAVAWLIHRYGYTPKEAQEHLLRKRLVRKSLYKQPNVLQFYEQYKRLT